MKIQNNKKKQYKNRKTPKETHTKQNKTKDKREREWEKMIFLPDSLTAFSSKSLEHNPSTLSKSYHLLDAIFF